MGNWRISKPTSKVIFKDSMENNNNNNKTLSDSMWGYFEQKIILCFKCNLRQDLITVRRKTIQVSLWKFLVAPNIFWGDNGSQAVLTAGPQEDLWENRDLTYIFHSDDNYVLLMEERMYFVLGDLILPYIVYFYY